MDRLSVVFHLSAENFTDGCGHTAFSLSAQFTPLMRFICLQNTMRFPASSFPSVVHDISTFSVLIQTILLSALLFCSQGKSLEKQH